MKKGVERKNKTMSSDSLSQKMTDADVTKTCSNSNMQSSSSYHCYMCDDFSGNNIEMIGSHVKKAHLNWQDGFGCIVELCNFRGLSMDEIHQHYEKAHEQHFKKSICLLCGENRENEDDLERHTRLVHLMDYQYACSRCKNDKKFATFYLDEWYDHVNEHHGKEKTKLQICRNEGYKVKGRKTSKK
jgi:hypothetical protein